MASFWTSQRYFYALARKPVEVCLAVSSRWGKSSHRKPSWCLQGFNFVARTIQLDRENRGEGITHTQSWSNTDWKAARNLINSSQELWTGVSLQEIHPNLWQGLESTPPVWNNADCLLWKEDTPQHSHLEPTLWSPGMKSLLSPGKAIKPVGLAPAPPTSALEILRFCCRLPQ